MMLMMHDNLLTHVSETGRNIAWYKLSNTKVSCSNCSTLFHLQEHTQVVDFKEFFTLLYSNVPMFQNIYKDTQLFLYFTMLSRGLSLFGSGCRQPHNHTGTLEQYDNERANTMIQKGFFSFNTLEQSRTMRNKPHFQDQIYSAELDKRPQLGYNSYNDWEVCNR